MQDSGKRTDCFDILVDGVLVLWVRKLESFRNQDSVGFGIEGSQSAISWRSEQFAR
jgi:hypothetical protein